MSKRMSKKEECVEIAKAYCKNITISLYTQMSIILGMKIKMET